MKGVEIAYLIDPDTTNYQKRSCTRLPRGPKGGTAPNTVSGRVAGRSTTRRLDAISIATPNHWHALYHLAARRAR